MDNLIYLLYARIQIIVNNGVRVPSAVLCTWSIIAISKVKKKGAAKNNQYNQLVTLYLPK